MATRIASSIGKGPCDGPLSQFAAIHKLHDDEDLVVFFLDRVDRRDIGVVQGRRGLCLDSEALAVRITGGDMAREKLYRDVAFQMLVVGFVDDTHPAFADVVGDSVVRNDLADHAGALRRVND